MQTVKLITQYIRSHFLDFEFKRLYFAVLQSPSWYMTFWKAFIGQQCGNSFRISHQLFKEAIYFIKASLFNMCKRSFGNDTTQCMDGPKLLPLLLPTAHRSKCKNTHKENHRSSAYALRFLAHHTRYLF